MKKINRIIAGITACMTIATVAPLNCNIFSSPLQVYAAVEDVAVNTAVDGMLESKATNIYTVTLANSGIVNVKFTSSTLSKIDANFKFGSEERNILNGTSTSSWNKGYAFDSATGLLTIDESYYFSAGTYTFTVENTGSEAGDFSLEFVYTDLGESFVETTENANNTYAKSSVIDLNTDYTGVLTHSDAVDYYKFTLDKAGKINLDLTSEMEGLKVGIVSADMTTKIREIGSVSKDSATGQITVSSPYWLASGDYYLVVEKNSYSGAYNFNIGYTELTESFVETQNGSNNTSLTASSIAFDTDYTTMLANDDTVDYYKFSLDNSGRINLNLTGGTELERVYVSVYESDMTTKVMSRSYFSKDSATNMINLAKSFDLTAGDYYLVVEKYDKYAGAYSFNVGYTASGETYDESIGGANNTVASASAVTFGETYNGQIAVNDSIDYYKIDIDSSGLLDVSFSGDMNSVYVRLYESDAKTQVSGGYVSRSDATRLAETNLTSNLTKGTYYLVVERYSSDYTGNYNFTTSFTSAEESFEETGLGVNNNVLDASVIEVNTDYIGQLAYNDASDFYSFTIDESGAVVINLSSSMNRLYYSIFNSDNEVLKQDVYCTKDSNTNMIIIDDLYDLTAGQYYIQIERYSNELANTGNYGLNIAYVSANETVAESGTGSNNTILTASAMEIGTEYTGQIAFNDSIDYYTFTLDEAQKLEISYISETSADIYICDKDDNKYFSLDAYWDKDEQISGFTENVELEAGTYYFVVSKDGYTGTYTVKFSETAVLGDVNEDGAINASDASAVLAEYASISSGGTATLDLASADVNKDGVINASDASTILAYYAYLSSGGTESLENFIGA